MLPLSQEGRHVALPSIKVQSGDALPQLLIGYSQAGQVLQNLTKQPLKPLVHGRVGVECLSKYRSKWQDFSCLVLYRIKLL